MDFIEFANNWAKSEVTQGKIMIGIGLLVVIAFVGILRSENELLRGSLVPLGLLMAVLIGYGGYILQSRPAHVEKSIALYGNSPMEAILKERGKHVNDNKAGKTLTRYVYPALIILSVVALFFVSSLYYKGMAIGFVFLFASTFVMDSGFVSRSDAFINFLDTKL